MRRTRHCKTLNKENTIGGLVKMRLLTKPLSVLLLLMLIFSNLALVEAQTANPNQDKTKSVKQTNPTTTPTPTPSPSQSKTLVSDNKGNEKVGKNDVARVIYKCPPVIAKKKIRKAKKRPANKPVVAKNSVKKKSTSRRKTPRKKVAKKKTAPKVVRVVAPVVTSVTLSKSQLKEIVDAVALKLGSNKLSEDDKTVVRQIVSEELSKTKTTDGNPSGTPPAGTNPTDDNQQGWFSSLGNWVTSTVSSSLAWLQANWHLVLLVITAIALWFLGRKYKWARWLSYAAIAALLYFWGFFSWLWLVLSGNAGWVVGAVIVIILALISWLFRADITNGIRQWRNPEETRATPNERDPQTDLYGDIPSADPVIDAEPVLDDDDSDENERIR